MRKGEQKYLHKIFIIPASIRIMVLGIVPRAALFTVTQ